MKPGTPKPTWVLGSRLPVEPSETPSEAPSGLLGPRAGHAGPGQELPGEGPGLRVDVAGGHVAAPASPRTFFCDGKQVGRRVGGKQEDCSDSESPQFSIASIITPTASIRSSSGFVG